jgi:hypothetical protein
MLHVIIAIGNGYFYAPPVNVIKIGHFCTNKEEANNKVPESYR